MAKKEAEKKDSSPIVAVQTLSDEELVLEFFNESYFVGALRVAMFADKPRPTDDEILTHLKRGELIHQELLNRMSQNNPEKQSSSSKPTAIWQNVMRLAIRKK
jgi:hypothetical protein